MDAIRASTRIAQATLPAVVAAPRHAMGRAEAAEAPIAAASAFAMTPAAKSDAGTRASDEERRSAEDLARRRELWARDMEVRTEDATELPDGSVHSLPTFEYEAGPDGRAYAVDGAAPVPIDPPEDPRCRGYVDGDDAPPPGTELDDVI
jgi:SprA family protein